MVSQKWKLDLEVSYKDGKIEEQIPYKEGKMQGVSKWYEKSGEVRLEVVFESDKAIGGKCRKNTT